MSFNLLNSVKQLFTDDVIKKAAAKLEETPDGISQAVSGIIPTILNSILTKTTSGNHEATNVLQLSKDAAESGVLKNLRNLFEGSSASNDFLFTGFDTVKNLFGDKLNAVVSGIADYAGIKESSSSTLLSGVAHTALGVLGNHVKTNNTNAGGLASSLEAHKKQILDAFPAELRSIANITCAAAVEKPRNATTVTSDSHKQIKFLWPFLVFALAIILLLYAFFKGCKSGSGNAAATETTINAASPAPAPVSIKVSLPDSIILDAYKGGIEDTLVNFLKTDYAKLGADSLKKIWFDFDNLNFSTGSAEITTASQHQITNIAAILKAFPESTIKIGGYTDRTGDEAVNKKLSTDRAEAVKTALSNAGVGKQVTAAEGYGSDFAKYPATAPESNRVHDRHISISVRL